MTTDNFKKHTSNNPLQRFLIANFYNNLLGIIEKLRPKKVLDAGAGEGFTLNKIGQILPKSALIGVDPSESALKLGRKVNPKVKLIKGSIYSLPFPRKSFDLIVCTEVLEHLEYPIEALKELRRVTSKYCLITVPNEPIFMLSNLARGKNIKRFGNDIEHIQHFFPRKLSKILKDNGFKIKEIRLPFPWIMILAEKDD